MVYPDLLAAQPANRAAPSGLLEIGACFGHRDRAETLVAARRLPFASAVTSTV